MDRSEEMNKSRDFAVLAVQSMLYEVTATPKPGLVDCHNNGAHHDMDIFTFMASSSVLSKGFYTIQEAAQNFEGPPTELLESLRPLGIKMEKDMFDATAGINTHKGMIFSLGILVAAAVQVDKQGIVTSEHIRAYAMAMCEGLSKELMVKGDKKYLTNGEKNFKSYGFTGIRGEAEAGFPTVFNYGLDAFRKSYYTLGCKNDLFIHGLLAIMMVCEDSNIISRHVPETLIEVQEMAKNFIGSGGMHQVGARQKLKKWTKSSLKDILVQVGQLIY